MPSVLITGASSGIGKQLALDYANEGYQVIACGRNLQRLKELQSENSVIETLAFDVTDRTAVDHAIGSLETIPELLILNAGDCEYVNNGILNSGLFERVFASNFFAVISVLEAMQSRLSSGTQIGIVSSSATFVALPRAEAYGASKAALSYFVNSLAIDWQPRQIGFSVISPGFVKTPLTDKNTFAMPMIVSPAMASTIIRKGLAKKKSHIHFPRRFTWLLKLLASLPQRWKTRLLGTMTGAQS
jgi:NAD(P)-dependent dehydrogenase (short-subunit alcohol dehydrogenase family)